MKFGRMGLLNRTTIFTNGVGLAYVTYANSSYWNIASRNGL